VTASCWAANGTVRVHYLDSDPEGEGPPIVFIPGLTDVADDYESILGEFGRRVIVIDLRGRGLSDAPDDGYALADHAGDIAAVVSAVTAGPVHLMTFSRGTCYGLTWAADNMECVGSIAIGDYPAREIIFPPDFFHEFMAGSWRGTPVEDRLARSALRGIVDQAVGRTFWDELGQFDRPMLAVRCGSFGTITEADWSAYGDLGPNVQRVIFEDSPHDLFRRDRLRYPHLVRDLVDRADAGG
jgi:non-heme chloroperoxidase